VLEFLQSIFPGYATNSEIVSRTGVRPHQQVYQKTQGLMAAGILHGRRIGRDWEFSVINGDHALIAKPAVGISEMREGIAIVPSQDDTMTAALFEQTARTAMGAHFGKPLYRGKVAGVPKIFDMVSIDHRVVGDAKFYTLVQAERQPSAKFSIIAGHVWLLERTQAPINFSCSATTDRSLSNG
jgi:hypothetical protein